MKSLNAEKSLLQILNLDRERLRVESFRWVTQLATPEPELAYQALSFEVENAYYRPSTEARPLIEVVAGSLDLPPPTFFGVTTARDPELVLLWILEVDSELIDAETDRRVRDHSWFKEYELAYDLLASHINSKIYVPSKDALELLDIAAGLLEKRLRDFE